MKILIIGGHSVRHPSLDRMTQYVTFFEEAGGYAEFCSYDDLIFWITNNSIEVSNGRTGLPIEIYDVIVLRGRIDPYMMFAEALCLYAKQKRIRFFNDYSRFATHSKLPQAITMQQHGLPIPATLVCDNPDELARQAARRLEYPIIAKDAYGRHGSNNFLVRNAATLKAVLREHSGITFVLQEFIPNDGDYRVLIAGDRELIIRRQALPGSHLNNTSQGGTASLVPVADFPAKPLRQAHEIATALGLTLAGVDIVQNRDSGDMVFLEVNMKPQLINGAFLDEKKHLIAGFLANSTL